MKAQVLIYQPELTHSVWVDHLHSKRSVESLRKSLRKAVQKGEYVGYRLITIHEEHVGATWKEASQ